MEPSIVYLTSWYNEKRPERRHELITCLFNCVNSPDIDKVVVLCEDDCPLDIVDDETRRKLIKVPFHKRPTYSDFFILGNIYSNPDDVIIVSNLDIYPQEGMRKHIKSIKHGQCYALSRWDIDTHGRAVHFDRKDSQDVWIFKSRIQTDKIKADFFIGVPGCDNRIASIIAAAGYSVTNPSKTIRFNHLHNTNIRNYDQKDAIKGPYLLPVPTELNPDKKSMVLHIGFAQPGLEKAFQDSFAKHRFVCWTDYQKNLEVLRTKILHEFSRRPFDLVFLQIQTAGVIPAELIEKMRAIRPDCKFVNWTGDVRDPLPEWYIELGRVMDLTLFSNMTDVKKARAKGIKADYLQIGFDTQLFSPQPPIKGRVGWPPIVFMGNNYGDMFPLSKFRQEMVKHLKTRYNNDVGIYGGNWGTLATANLMGHEKKEADCYRACKIAINLSHFDYERYSSDRIFRIMASGAFCLAKHYPGIELEFTPGMNLDTWSTISELDEKIKYYINSDEERNKIAAAGCQHVYANHTWENRVQELKDLLNI
jgi:glycosyltransferase involved in cell wall biosynthesis